MNALLADEQQSRAIYELCSIIIQILKSPPLLHIPLPISSRDPSSSSSSSSSSRSRRQQVTISQVSPTAFASLFLGISLALMLFGSVTFIIGLVLMPWVIALLLLYHLVAVVSTLSELWTSFVASMDVNDVPCNFLDALPTFS